MMYQKVIPSEIMSEYNSNTERSDCQIPEEYSNAKEHIEAYKNLNICNTQESQAAPKELLVTQYIDGAINSSVIIVANKIASKREAEYKLTLTLASLKQENNLLNQLVACNQQLLKTLNEKNALKSKITGGIASSKDFFRRQKVSMIEKYNKLLRENNDFEGNLNKLAKSLIGTDKTILSNKQIHEAELSEIWHNYEILLAQFSSSKDQCNGLKDTLQRLGKIELKRSQSVNSKSRVLRSLVTKEFVSNLTQGLSSQAHQIIISPKKNIRSRMLKSENTLKHSTVHNFDRYDQ